MKILRKNYKNSVIRKIIYRTDRSKSLLINFPLKFAEDKGIHAGDYVKIINKENEIVIKKIDMEE